MRRAGTLAAMRAKWARPSVTPPPTMTKYCGTARPSSLRTLPWKPRPAMWCWPQPFGQPLILMLEVGGALGQSGPGRDVLLQQPRRGRATA